MNQLMDYLRENDKPLSERVVGTLTVDENHMTENQLLAKARDFYDRL